MKKFKLIPFLIIAFVLLAGVTGVVALSFLQEGIEDNVLVTVSGTGDLGNIDGDADETRFALPHGLCFDNNGNLIIFDTYNAGIKRSSDGSTETILGFSEAIDDFGFIMPGYFDGERADALFGRPTDGVYSSDGDLFIVDSVNNAIRILRGDRVYTFAGGTQGHADGRRGNAGFDNPMAIAIDSNNNLYVTDTFNHTIRMITPAGVVSTIAGSPGTRGYADGSAGAALFNDPSGIAVDNNGVIYVADTGNQVIRKIENGNVTTIAGIADPPEDDEEYSPAGYEDGPADSARFNSPHGLYRVNGVLLIADTGNHTIRALLADGNVTTVAGSGTPGDAEGIQGEGMMNKPTGLVYRNGVLYIADTLNNKIKAVLINVIGGEIA